MKTLVIGILIAGAAATFVATANASSPAKRARRYNWHANYMYTPYAAPTALVVPPTAQLQTNWGWGAPSSRISRIDHQFTRDYMGGGGGSPGFMRYPPHWPQDTAQLGVYYVRGPWYPTQP